jgi:hypothetical protein
MTVMVRDEADVIGAMLDHHADQGIDEFIVTDNGSIDGTREIIEELSATLPITLLHDPEHRKQQGETVTRMARTAAERGATWVLNADADEFWVAQNPRLTLREAFARIDPGLGSFTVPVHDMIGAPAAEGTGLQRLVYRDDRPVERMREVGVHAHATPDSVHVADPEVVVSQGNHFVNIPSKGRPDPEWAVEVLHFPWRSWAQFSGKVERAGLAYEASPHLEPSANHHGMRDYRRLRDGVLLASYVARHPDAAELEAAIAAGRLVEDRRIADSIASPVADVALDPAVESEERALWSRIAPIEQRLIGLQNSERAARDDLRGARADLDAERAARAVEVRQADERTTALHDELDRAHREIHDLRARRVVRLADRFGRFLGAHPR